MAFPQLGAIVAKWGADDITPVANDTPIAAWVDSVSSISAAQATGAKQPSYQNSVLGGMPSVRFDGGDLLPFGATHAVQAAVDTQTFTIALAFKCDASLAGYGALFNAWPNNFLYADGTEVGSFFDGPQAHVPFAGQTDLTTIVITSTTTYTINGAIGLTRVFINGGCIGSKISPAANSGGEVWAIGCNAAENFFFIGDFFDAIVWDQDLTVAEVLQFEKEIRDKYSQPYVWDSQIAYLAFLGDSQTAGVGIQNNASESYPYKTAAALGFSVGQYANLGIGAIDMVSMEARISEDLAGIAPIIDKKVAAMLFEWRNQASASPTPRNNSLSYLAAARSSAVLICFGTSFSDVDDPNQDRQDYNDYFDADHTSATMDAFAPFHLNTSIGIQTAYATNGAGAGLDLYDDEVHFKPAGQTIQASIAQVGLQAVLDLIGLKPGVAALVLAGLVPSVGIAGAQFLAPDSDVSSDGAWEPTSGTTRYSMIDEFPSSDDDSVATALSSERTFVVSLADATDPVSNANHYVRYRLRGGGSSITVTLLQTSTVIASWVHSPPPNAMTTFRQLLSGAEADSISDYTALRLSFKATP